MEDPEERRERLRRSLDESGVFLAREMGARLGRYARSRGLDEPAAEEVVQDAFVAILARSAVVAHPEAWLVRVVDRRCCDWHRRRRAAERAVEALATGASEVGPSQPSATLDLAAALARLPERLRQVVRLRYIEGLGAVEAAAQLGYSPASYRTTLARALAALRELLGVPELEPSR